MKLPLPAPRSLIASLVLLGAVAAQATQQPVPPAAAPEGQATLSAALERATRLHDRVAGPLQVNGEPLDPQEVERQTVYMVGQRETQQKLIEMIVEDQMAEQIKAGVDKKVFDVIEADVQAQIAKTISDFQTKNPGKDFWTELRRTNTTQEEYLTLQRSTLLFDKVFFRGIPSQWPEITKEAIIASGGPQGQEFFTKFAEAVKEGQEVPPLWLHICRQWVVGKMQDWSDVRYASDGLEPAACLSLNGRVWRTADASRVLALKIKPEDRTRALVDIVLQTALKQELRKNDAWMSDDQFRKEFEEYCKPYEGSPFNVKVLALSFKGYPSYEVYKSRWRLERSFEHMIEKEINDDNLGKHLERARQFLADGRVSLRVARIPAFDDATGTWRENGFALARAEAEDLMAQLERGTLTFDDVMSKHAKWPEHFKDQGVLNGKSLNEIRTELRETEYTDFIHGYSVGEILFYDAKPGDVVGPLRGQDGYYIAMLSDRTPALGTIDLADKNKRDLVKQDYVSHRFLAWANEVARRTQVR